MLGVKFGYKDYVLTILKDVEDEVMRSSKLRSMNPWFNEADLTAERMNKRMRLSNEENRALNRAQGVLHGWVKINLPHYTTGGRSPPNAIDCKILAFGQIRSTIVVTDDLGMHDLAKDFGITVWHGPELLAKLLSARKVDNDLMREIYDALERNMDLTKTWIEAKHTTFKKVFGNKTELPIS